MSHNTQMSFIVGLRHSIGQIKLVNAYERFASLDLAKHQCYHRTQIKCMAEIAPLFCDFDARPHLLK